MGIFCLLIAGMTLPTISLAQDVIIKKNGDEIQAKILEVNTNEIKFKKIENIDGPTYVVSKADVFIIKYANGTREIVSALDAPARGDMEVVNQKKLFRQGKTYVSLGYGLGTFFSLSNSSWLFGIDHSVIYDIDRSNATYTGPFYVKYDYGMTEDFSIGISLAYLEGKFKDMYYGYYYFLPSPYSRTYTYKSFSGLLHANWHFGNSEKVDPYIGFGVGYRSGTWNVKSDDPQQGSESYSSDFPLGFETTFGVRVKFSKRFGAYVEAGFAKSVLQGGFMTFF